MDAVDAETIEQLREVMEDEFEDLLQTYLETAPNEIGRICNALRLIDADALAHSAHTLKGSSANLGAMQLSALCKDLEALGKAKQVDDETARLVDLIGSEYEKVQALLRQYLRTP